MRLTGWIALASAVFAAGAASAAPAEEILFKVGNVKQVKSGAGDVINCTFDVSAYNRTPLDVKGALLDIEWEDKAVEEEIADEKTGDLTPDAVQKMLESLAKRSEKAPKVVKTADTAAAKLRKAVSIPAMRAYEQAVVNASLNTDRCFLLLGEAAFTAKNCSTVGSGSGSGSASCNDLFRFVSPREEQYYVEFRKETLAEQKAAQASKQEKMKARIEEEYVKAVKSFDEVAGALDALN